MAISVELGGSLERVVEELLRAGRYNSKSEVLREGVRLVQERESRLAALDAAVARGLSDAEAGLTEPLDDAFDRIEAKLRAKL